MSRIVLTTFAQTAENTKVVLPVPLSNVKSMQFQLLSATGLTSTGDLFWLTCPDVRRTNIPQSTIHGLQYDEVWREISPLPSGRTNYLPPLTFEIETGNPAANDIQQFTIRLFSDGTITPGFAILWEVTWEIGGPDNLLAPY